MKSNPLIPFGIIFVLGIVLMFIIAFYGASQLGQTSANGGGKGQTTQSTSSANADPKQIFEQHCSSCHGKNLQGGIGPSLQHIGGKWSKQQILKQIKTGGGPGGMPPNVIQGQAAEKVATWLSKKK